MQPEDRLLWAGRGRFVTASDRELTETAAGNPCGNGKSRRTPQEKRARFLALTKQGKVESGRAF